MRRLIAAVLTAALILIAGIAAPSAQDTEPALTTYTLDNGLEVMLVPDHKVPKVSVTVSYRVGVLNEPAGRSGFAHIFEHLMLFSGTKAYPSIDNTFTALGISYNGYTTEDATTYYGVGLASTLPVLLSVHADQMANIGNEVDQAALDLQRSVVLNEMRQNVLDAPAASGFEALRSGLFAAPHPYSRAVIGSIPDVQAATLEDVKTFFNAYYVPNQAVLAVVGDFEIADAKAMIEDTFGRIARGAEIATPTVAAATPTRIRVETVDAVSTPIVYLGFTGPNAFSEENAGLYIAGDLMSSESGMLRKQLVNTGIASYAGGSWAGGRLGGRFVVFAVAAAGVTAEDLEAALRKTVADFVAAPVDAADFERSKSGFLLSTRAALEGYQTRSDYLARAADMTDDPSELLGDDPDLVAATPAKVEAAVRKVLVLDDASSAVIRPGARGSYPPVLSEPSGTPQPLVAPDRAPVDIPVLAAGEPQTVDLPPRQTATLSNGVEIIHYQMPDAPLLYITTMFSGGQNNDPPGREGLYDLAIGVAGRGAGDYDLEALSRAARDIGAAVGTWAGALKSGATLSVPPDEFAAGVDLLADVTQRPRFDAGEWNILRAQTLEALVQRESDLQGVAQRALNRVLFVPGPGDSAMHATIASVEPITLAEAKAAFHRLFVPKTMTIYSVGALPVEELTPALEARFGTWQAEGEGVAAKPALPAVFPAEQQVYLRPMAGTSQAMILVARPGPGLDDPGFAGAYVVGNLLGGDFSSRLNTVIREQKGYSYGVSAGVLPGLRHDGAMLVAAPVQVDATGAALTEVFRGFESLTGSPVTGAEMARTVTAQQTTLASLPETAASLFSALVGAEGDGISLAESLASLEQVAQLQLMDVQSEAQGLAGLDRAVVVIAGDPALIGPQLEAIGITDVQLVESGG